MLLNRGSNAWGGSRWLARCGAALLGLGLMMGWGGASRLMAQGAPKVSTVTPATGATGVELTSSLVFVFDQIMGDTPVVPSIPGLFVGNLQVTPASVPMFECEWSEDSRTLTCTPGGDLPPSTTVNWTLNPAGAVLKISSGGGVALATTTGSFTTAAGGGGGGGGGNEGDPKLLATTPANGATAVPVTAAVRFVFDQAMQKNPGVGGAPPFAPGAVAWAGTGLDPAKFTYAWSQDGKTLLAEYSGDLPGSSEISWALNPATALVKLANEAGNELPEGLYSGSFTTAAGSGGGEPCDSNGIPDEWGVYTVSKVFNYVQESAADPTGVLEDALNFGAVVQSPELGPAVTAAQVTVPSNAAKTLEGVPFGGFFVFSEVFDTPAALNTAYPGGNYTLKFTQIGQSERSIAMTMPGSTPPTPKISNFAEAQAINATQAFTVRWNAFTGASADDSILFSIMDQATEVFSAPDPCVPRELAVTATSIEIPANTLAAGKSYRATLSFGDVFYFSSNAVPNMVGFASVSVTTELEIRTTGGGGPGPAAPARFTSYRMLENGRPQMSLTGTAGRTYTLERATRISPGDWQAAGTVVMDAGGNATFEDAQPGAFRPLYYRAVAP